MNIPIVFLVSTGLFFCVVAAVGAVRLPDFYTRSHAIGVTDTLGVLLILGGAALYLGVTFTALKLFLLVLFIYVANPTVTHVLMRAALRCGLKPYTRGEAPRS